VKRFSDPSNESMVSDTPVFHLGEVKWIICCCSASTK